MRIGLNLPNFDRLGNVDAVVKIGRAAEERDFASLWVTDHVLLPTENVHPYGNLLEVFTTLSFLAAQTTRIRLGTSVLVLPQREPILVAKQAATVQHLSRGRFTLGVGVGWVEKEYGYLGASFRRRGRHADTYISAIQELWTSDTPHFCRAPVAFDDVVFSPANRDLASIPIVIGGKSQAALRRVAILGDGWHAFERTPDQIAAGVGVIRTVTERPFTVDLRVPVAAGRSVPAGVDPDVAVSGSPESMIDRIRDWELAGVDQLVLEPVTTDLTTFLRDLDLLAAHVLPTFASTGVTPG